MCLLWSLVINKGDKCDNNVSFIAAHSTLIELNILLVMAPSEMRVSLYLIIHVAFFFWFGPATTSSGVPVRFSSVD